MKHRLFLIIISVVAVLTATSAIGVSLVNAQAASNSAAQGLQISPTKVELNAEKGKTYTITLTVTNVTLTDLVYNASVEDFNSKDETGTPQVLLNSTLPETSSIITWISTDSQFTLKSKQSRTVTAHLTVPDNAEPGGHYGVVLFSGRPPELESSGVALSASTGALILVRVAGDITEKASLASFYTANAGSQTSFFETGPIGFVTRINNEGNIHIKPVGTITVHDTFGGLVATLPVNDESSNVLPGSIRRFEATYSADWMFGRYTADLALGYGTTGQAITASTSFWVIPYKLLLAGLAILATLIFIMTKLIKAYNRHIIAKSKNETNTKNKNRKKKNS